MCTAFVRKGKDVIVGFNMDINLGAVNYDVYVEPDQFYVGVNPAGVRVTYPELAKNYAKGGELSVIRIHGINHKGNFGNCLNNMRFTKAPFKSDTNVISIDQVVDSYISGTNTLEDVIRIANEKEIVNLPKGSVEMPDLAMHSLLADREGKIMILEPGNGYSFIQEKYAVLSNFSMLELPGDFCDENAKYYGKDRYDKAMRILRNSSDDFSVEDGMRLLRTVKQEGIWATRVSFVYSNNENAVYYCMERDFDHVIRHRFTN